MYEKDYYFFVQVVVSYAYANFFDFIFIWQAYDGHMNLIMSEVEETIMLVDPDSVTNGRGVVNVCVVFLLR